MSEREWTVEEIEAKAGEMRKLLGDQGAELASMLEQAASDRGVVERLKEKISRDPVWLIPDKIVTHAGQCFKLRTDDPGPRIVIEKRAKISLREAAKQARETAGAT